jgi:hypothetical protein
MAVPHFSKRGVHLRRTGDFHYLTMVPGTDILLVSPAILL